MSEVVAAIVAHADDEALGCGGTLAKHVASGDSVYVVFVADGTGSRSEGQSEGALALQQRQRAAIDAVSKIGAQSPIFLDLPDNQLDALSLLEVIKTLEPVLTEIDPTIIYTHHGGDLNIDHRTVCQAVMTIFRPMPSSGVKAIYGFETMSSTEWRFDEPRAHFTPNRYVDVSNTFEKKVAALRAYDIEMREFPHPRSIKAVEALATYRGATVGCTLAEAFTVLRQVDF
ncbi:N-acetylglucosaminyl deacetylase, LmbE family [Pseudovibrio denitrificans]|uniref:N-acetylglucosaminyl deacetylase, LmbE family n=1 Tax=Pseudovibrio denitrificans TaxID=258256 RepID=A0A1I7CTT6_9HYPH|nr:PIG-L family deacetylase [Pseudovibrio denitrificans]SFU02813.1 N-acetylglucosaminyl deacetylase, LmbE family [Pseudovibrio denitrificans]